MPFLFSEISTLLSRLEDIELKDPPYLPAEKLSRLISTTRNWFQNHRQHINELETPAAVALISMLLPERRTDRVYNIQATRLCRILGRCLNFGAARAKDLQAYKQPGRGDLATCVQRVFQAGGPAARPPVTLEEVDDMLDVLAGLSFFSAPSATRLPPGSSEERDKRVGNIFKRATAEEAKWFVRLILKDFAPVRIDNRTVLQSFHFLLPDLLRFQNDLSAAIGLLKDSFKDCPPCPDPRSEEGYRQSVREFIRPVVGVKVGKLDMWKARSIDHCVKMVDKRKWVLERKYDGEYCEIHVDVRNKLLRPERMMKIFSKSGKDSADDREEIHQTLVECLRLGRPECKIKQQAIVLGELVVYSDEEQRVLPFDKIRKHVSRGGRWLGTDNDSPPTFHEHLAIVFFDILLLDDKIIMNKPVEERRNWLREVYTKIHGRAWSAEWKVVDFSEISHSRRCLEQQFAASIAERHEGLILKPCGSPYFSLTSQAAGRTPNYIKLKKDYMDGLGDEADFAVVGGSYNAQQAATAGLDGLKWTEFHLGCLMNKADVLRFDARPCFKVVATIQHDKCIPKPILQTANTVGNFMATAYEKDTPPEKFDLDHDASTKIQHVFDTPLVFEVLGSGFVKPPNCNFSMLRHPRVKQMHEDRSWKDCISLDELQEQARQAVNVPTEPETQENLERIQKLANKIRKKCDSMKSTPARSSVNTTPATTRSTVRTARTSTLSTKIDGTTLVEDPDRSAKRQRKEDDETPCPAYKRVCADYRERTPQRRSAADNQSDFQRSALSEISPNAVRRQPAASSSKPPLHSVKNSTTPCTITESSAAQQTPAPPPCTSAVCPFKDAVLYFAPSQNAHRQPQTLSRHTEAITISDLAHWDRDSFSHPPLTETVSESQAYGDMTKIVLVSSKVAIWRAEFEALLRQVGGFNQGCFGEKIEFWDTEALDEECTKGSFGARSQEGKFMLGRVVFDEEVGRMVWKPKVEVAGADRVEARRIVL